MIKKYSLYFFFFFLIQNSTLAQVVVTWVHPNAQEAPVQAESPLDLLFDLEISGLSDNDTAYFYLVFRLIDPDWNEIITEAKVTEMPYETTFVNPFDEDIEIWYDIYVKINDEDPRIYPGNEPNPSAWFIDLSPASNNIKSFYSQLFHKHEKQQSYLDIYTLNGRKIFPSSPLIQHNFLYKSNAQIYLLRGEKRAVKKIQF